MLSTIEDKDSEIVCLSVYPKEMQGKTRREYRKVKVSDVYYEMSDGDRITIIRTSGKFHIFTHEVLP